MHFREYQLHIMSWFTLSSISPETLNILQMPSLMFPPLLHFRQTSNKQEMFRVSSLGSRRIIYDIKDDTVKVSPILTYIQQKGHQTSIRENRTKIVYILS